MRRLLLPLVLLAACADSPPPNGPPQRIRVPAGASFADVTDTLVAYGVVTNPLWFKVQARLKRVDRSIHAGVYEIARGLPVGDVLALLAAGKSAVLRFTVPEGLTVADVAALAEERLRIPAESIRAVTSDSAFAASLGVDAPTLEGFLHPNTYELPLDVDARELAKVMVDGFTDRWKPEWDRRLDTLGMTRRQLLALASIVEGEARVDEERETIAGVYHNRLRIGMALQADPTVQYAIMLRTGERKARLFQKDYQTPSPYNTYLNPGLPPGPVNSPSLRSIEAALYPADVPYFFFVAGTDGRHVFTRTYPEHLQAIAQIRRRR
jgi:UPF0755 protein